MEFLEVQDRIRSDNETKWDSTLGAEEMVLHNGRMTFPRLYRAEHPDGLLPTPWATHQLCQRLSIPIAYYRRCPTSLQDVQVNHWLHEAKQDDTNGSGKRGRKKEPEQWFLRAKGDLLRGVLTDRYVRLDNADLMTALGPLMESRFEVSWFALSDESLHLRITDPRLTREVLPNDRLVAGLHIANSEVGKRSVTVDALVFRLVCSNGLVRLVKGRSLLHQRHVALTRPEFAIALRDAIREALIHGAGFMERLSWATQQTIADVDATLDKLAEQWRLSQTTQGRVRKAILCERGGQQETLYGLVNGLTNAAQQLGADERYTLETLAGQLLESGPPRIERTAQAAVKEQNVVPRSLFAEEEFAPSFLRVGAGSRTDATGPASASTPARPVNG